MRYHGIVLLFIFIISTAFSDEPEKDGGEKRIGYEDGQITSVTVYTGDTKPTGETVPSTGTGTGSGTSGGGSADSGTTTGGAQQQGPFTGFPGRPRPRPRPGHGRPGYWFRPFGYRGGRRTVSQGEEEENSSSENVGPSPQ